MIRSRVTLARIDAAAIDRQVASPLHDAPGAAAPTDEVPVAVDEDLVGLDAEPVDGPACRQLLGGGHAELSHSSWLAWPTAQVTHHSAMRSNMTSRSGSVSIFESRTL